MNSVAHPAWLDRFYPIIDSVAWLEPLLAAGARLVQLRIKHGPQPGPKEVTSDVIRAAIVSAREICLRARVQLILNDHWQLAIETGCDFVHLGQGDLDSADVPALRHRGIKLGISTHDHAELQRALALQPDYVALGPIYPTQLKQMPWAPQGLERIAEWKRAIGALPLVAIGGLTVERVTGVLAAGADSAAVITDIVTHTTPAQRIREWVAATRS
jgi:thiamine-phosphate pyrophosphorylase